MRISQAIFISSLLPLIFAHEGLEYQRSRSNGDEELYRADLLTDRTFADNENALFWDRFLVKDTYQSIQPTTKPVRPPSSSGRPTKVPYENPSSRPSNAPYEKPYGRPSKPPTKTPYGRPSKTPTKAPYEKPSSSPPSAPYKKPSKPPTKTPYARPSTAPYEKPSSNPSNEPYEKPSSRPSKTPSEKPYGRPSKSPLARQPTRMPIRANYTVSGIVKQKNVLSSLEAALGEANLLDELAKDGNFTLFAPTDSAIARSDLDFIAQLAEPEWMLHLRNLLLFHVIDSGSLLSKNFKNVARISMMNGESNTLTAKETSGIVGVTKYFVDGSLVAETDLIASNGVVHTVESVIFPSFYRRNLMDYLDQTAELSILADLVRRAGLLNVARNDTLTLFAPNNAAFRNLPRGTLEALQDPANINLLRNVLLYHLAEGVLPIVNDVAAGASTAIILSLLGPPLEITITKNDSILNKRTPTNQTNTLARNGIIHIVSGVLRPPAPAPVTATPPTSPSKSPSTAPSTRKDTKPPVLSPTITVTSAPSQKPKTLLDFIVADRSLSLFSSALVSTGLSQTFANDGFLILFAPTNAAFRALPIESLNKLLSLEWDLHLKSLLLFHTAAFGAPRSLKLTDEMTIKMLNSDEVDIDIDTNGGVSLSSRFTPSVVANSVNASAVNGEAYKIDRLLLPNFVNLDVVDLVEESANLQILSDLIRIAELEDFIRDGPLTLLAPINNAFDALSEEEIEFLLDPANVSQLRRLLLYHVIEGLLPASQLKTGTVATTSMGATINVTVTNQVIRLTGNSQVLLKDRLASNGIIHVIEGVLIPPSTFTIVSEPKTEKKRKSVVKIIHHIVQRLPGH